MPSVEVELLTGLSDCHIHWFNSSLGIHRDMNDAWQLMCRAAQRDGIELAIASGYRSFERQLSIWNRKFSGELAVLDINESVIDISRLSELELVESIMLFSALPGASRHHWGTDIDVFATNLLPKDYRLKLEVSEYRDGGPLVKLYHWLEQHAATYGFSLPYNAYTGGVAEEPWHLSYQPLAATFEQSFSQATLVDVLSQSPINGKQTLLNNIDTLYNRFISSTFHAQDT